MSGGHTPAVCHEITAVRMIASVVILYRQKLAGGLPVPCTGNHRVDLLTKCEGSVYNAG
jgi:hypothetical protein